MRTIGGRRTGEAGQTTKILASGVMLLALLLGMTLPAHGAESLTIRPNNLVFGAVLVGRSSALSVTMTNNNLRSVQIVGISISSPFSYSGLTLPATVLSGQSLTISVTFNPAAIQGYSGRLTFSLSNGSRPSAALSGSGVAAAGVAPLITTQPAGSTTVAGQSVTFSAAVSGTAPLSYQWNRNGTAITGATSATYTLAATTTTDSGAQFSVTVKNTAGSVTSGSAMLTVNPATVAPQITAQPVNQTVTTGQAASFVTSVTGTAPFGYQWMKNGVAISGGTAAGYTTPATTAADNGAQFSVTVSNPAGSASSSSASLTVNTPVTPPVITTQPGNQTIPAGQTGSFSVAASGTGPLSYQWMKNGGAISGGSSSSYTTPASTTTDNGSVFTVAVSNTAGSTTSSGAMLSVTAASSCQTSSAAWTNTTMATQTTAFTASYDATPAQAGMDGVVGISLGAATGYGSLAAIVRFNPSGMIDAMNGAGYTADVAMPYGAGVPYHFRAVIDPTSYVYSVYVTAPGGAEVLLANKYAFRSQQATTSSLNNWGMIAEVGSQTVCNMSLSITPVVPVAPLITTQPAGSTTVAGQSVTFSAAVSGTAPLSYQWNRNGTAITGATSATYTLAATTTTDSGAQFSVTVKNTAGSVTSGSAMLTVNPATVAPQITAQPVNQTVTTGQAASFVTSVTGTAPFGYQWMKNGVAISGGTAAGYTTPATTAADNGAQFSVTVSNPAGSASSSSASLTVNTPVTPPVITTQPGNQTIPAGQTGSFSVAASGTGPLSYQWMKNGGAISGGSSSSYTTPASTTTDNGSVFTVAVSNTAGSTTSSGAMLSVTAASSCQTSSAAWTNTTMATQTTAFTASYDATPAQAGMDGVVGISLGAATGYGSLAAIVRFNPSGMIDAMNGAGYTADVAMPYGAGVPYHFRAVIDPTSYVYSVYVTAPGGAEVLLANKYAFRSQQATTSSLNNWGMIAEVGSQTVCNMSLSITPVVPVAPLITTQPTGSTTVAGQSVTFSAAVSGTAPLSYQWNRNGTAITGATSATYTLAATTTTDSGAQFSVTVKNTAGSVTSGSAMLTVNAMSASLTGNTSSLNFGTVALGSNGTLSATLTNSGNSNVTISNVSVSGAGFNASGLSSGQTIAAGQSATLNVTLTPSSTGSATGSLTVASNAANSPVTVALAGTGGPAAAQHQVNLSWSASSSSVIGYNVYSGAVSGGPYSKVTASPIANTSYSDASVHSGTIYYYIVTSVSPTNTESVYSNEVAAAIP